MKKLKERKCLVPVKVVLFLRGESPLEGIWFGEKHPKHRGAFWWRRYLKPPELSPRVQTSRATPSQMNSRRSET